MTDTIHPALAELFDEDHCRLSLQVQNYGLTIVQGAQHITSREEGEQDWTHCLEIELGHNQEDIFAEVELIVGHHEIFDAMKNKCWWSPYTVEPNSPNNGACWIANPDRARAIIATTVEIINSIVTALQTNEETWMNITVSGPFEGTDPGELRPIFAFAIVNQLSRQTSAKGESALP